MIDVLLSILAFIFALGLLITFHEFGHYWVARKCDVKILRFSVGFGKPLWRRAVGADNTEFVIATLPLGGYVKMLDEREGQVPEAELPRAFNNKPLPQRFAIVLAGPLFNFIFAVFAYWLLFMLGVTGLKPVIGEITPDSPAAVAGLRQGDEIIAVDGVSTRTWNSVFNRLIGRAVAGQVVQFELQGTAAASRTVTLDLGQIGVDEMAAAGGGMLGRLGLAPLRPPAPAIVGEVLSDHPAAAAGLQPGDEILALNDGRIDDWAEFVAAIQAAAGQSLELTIRRGEAELDLDIVPAGQQQADGSVKGFAGVRQSEFQPDPAFLATESYTLFPALQKSLVRTAEMSVLTLRVLGQMITGRASVKNISGPIGIAQYAGQTAQLGFVAFLGFLAIISISLGVLNLLPVPLLDGGHLCYYLVEAIKGSPVSDGVQALGQRLGLLALLGLMSLAIYNDILRLLE
ncbi:MAG: RIP metalloprotease RseP [Gammaproteobacteria bacterium]